MNNKLKLIFISITLGIALWLVDILLDSYLYLKIPFVETLTIHLAGMRLLFHIGLLVVLIGFAFAVVSVLDKRTMAEISFSKAKEKYRTLVELSPDPIVIMQNGTYKMINSAFTDLFGYSEKEVLEGLSFFAMVQEKDMEAVRQRSKDRLEGKKPLKTFQIDLIAKNGNIISCETSETLITHDERPADLVIIRDISERKKAENAIADLSHGIYSAVGEDYFTSVVKYLSQSLQADYAYIAEFVGENHSCARTLALWSDGNLIDNLEVDLSGTPCETVVGKEICSYPSGVRERFPEAHMMARLGVQAYFGATLDDSHGEHRGLLTVMYRNPVEQTEMIESVLKIFAARTSAEIERRMAENRLKESEERYRKVFENSSFGISICDQSGQCILANRAVADMVGGTVEQILSQNYFRLESWKKSGLLDAVKEALESGEKKRGVFHVLTSFGKDIWLDCMFVPYIEKGRNFIMFLVEDVTAQKRAEEELIRAKNELEVKVKQRTADLEKANEKLKIEIERHEETEKNLSENEKRFRAVAMSTSDLIWEGDVRDNTLIWHGDIDRILGYEPGAFPRTVSGHMESVHPDDMDKFIEAVEKAVASGDDFYAEYRIRCRNGEYRDWSERGRAIGFEKGRAVEWVGSVTDITEKKRAEALLIQEEKKYRKLSQEFHTLLDAIPDSLILLSPDLKILWFNKAFETQIRNYSNEDNEQLCYRVCFGRSEPCDNCPVVNGIQSRREESAIIRDEEGRIFDKRAFPILDETGRVTSVIELSRDITARIQMEEEAKLVQARLIHANKMTSLGMLVTGVAHEINNPNSYIMSNIEMFAQIWKDAVGVLQEKNHDRKDMVLGGIPFEDLVRLGPELLGGIRDGALRIKNIIQRLTHFGKPDRSSLEGTIDIEQTIRSACALLDNHIKKLTDRFTIECENNIPPVSGSSQQIEQVIINLVMNALQSLPDRKSGIVLSCFFDTTDESVVVSVKDEGVGISDTIMRKIIDPFFTTRSAQGGTGLGLSISNAIIRDHGGKLLFESEEGKGTKVTVKLPVKRNAK